MKPRRDVTPYMFNSDKAVNASLTIMKIRKQIRLNNPLYKQISLYQMRLKNRQAARRLKPHIVR